MAKRKMNAGAWREVSIRDTIRSLIRSGLTDRRIQNIAEDVHTGRRRSTIQRILREERKSHSNVQTLLKSNRGRFANPATLLGCPEGMEVRVTIAVSLYNKEEKRWKQFDTTTSLPKSGRLKDILIGAIGQVMDHAKNVAEGRYRMPTATALYSDFERRVTISSARCMFPKV